MKCTCTTPSFAASSSTRSQSASLHLARVVRVARRVRAVDAVERAAIRELRDERVRPRRAHSTRPFVRELRDQIAHVRGDALARRRRSSGERGDDLVHRARPVAQLDDRGGARVEHEPALRIEQHVLLIALVEAQARAPGELRDASRSCVRLAMASSIAQRISHFDLERAHAGVFLLCGSSRGRARTRAPRPSRASPSRAARGSTRARSDRPTGSASPTRRCASRMMSGAKNSVRDDATPRAAAFRARTTRTRRTRSARPASTARRLRTSSTSSPTPAASLSH